MKHIKNRVTALLLTLAMVLSLAPMAFAADEFPDMPAEDDASYAAVKSAIDNKIMGGENGKLNLEGTIIRSTVAKMVTMAFAAKGEADMSAYSDAEGNWAVTQGYLPAAVAMGIMSGNNGKMEPNREVTLAEVAAMLARALGLPTDKDAKLDGVADWAAPYVKALIDAGYISAEAAADAGKPMTRVEFAEVIYKVSGGNYVKESCEYTQDVDGNIVITADGVSLKGITVKGDVIIADGVDAGSIVMDNVKIEGRLVVRGGAEAELKNGTTASATVVAKPAGEVTVKADMSSDAGDITVSGTDKQVADKVTIDMPEPNVTVTAATEVAVQNANGGEVTLQANGASLSVESGTLENVTVADGASDVKVDVAADATIEKVTSNEDVTVTGEGTVEEKEGSGKVTDAEGNEVAGPDEPVDVPTVVAGGGSSAAEATPPAQEVHTHNYDTTGAGKQITQLNATHHLVACVNRSASGTPGQEGYLPAITGCGGTITVAHSFDPVTHLCVCNYKEQTATEGTVTGVTGEGAHSCGSNHHWVKATGDGAYTAPTCSDDGSQKMICDNVVTPADEEAGTAAVYCTAQRIDTIPATGHNLTLDASQPATCGEDGYQDYYCTTCEKYKKADGTFVTDLDGAHTVTIAKGSVPHNLVRDTSADDPATCAKAGTEGWKCSKCGDNQNKPLPADPNNHVWGGSWTAVADTDTHSRTCAGDANKTHNTDETETSTHTWVLDTAAVAATCGANGKTAKYKCSVCNAVKGGEAIDKGTISHIMSNAWVNTNATHHWHDCSVCHTYASSAPSSTGEKAAAGYATHTWDKGTTDEEGNVTPAAGAKCTVCGYVNGGGGAPVGPQGDHEWSNGKCTLTTNGHNPNTCTCTNASHATDVAAKYTPQVGCQTCKAKGTKDVNSCSKKDAHGAWPTATTAESVCDECGTPVTHVHNYVGGMKNESHGTCACGAACPGASDGTCACDFSAE